MSVAPSRYANFVRTAVINIFGSLLGNPTDGVIGKSRLIYESTIFTQQSRIPQAEQAHY